MSQKIVVIGAGPAGYPAALKAAALGAEVTLIEQSKPGGVCLNCGCIPSKSLLDAAHKFYELKKTAALSTNPQAAQDLFNAVDFTAIQNRRAMAITKLQRGLMSLFKNAKIDYIEAKAQFTSAHTVEAGGREVNFDYALIACGSSAFYPPPFDKVKDKLYDNSNIFNLQKIPQSITILGGGVIGCEFACIFNALGSKVTIVEMLPNIIALEDEACSTLLKRSFEKRGINIITGQAAKDIQFEDDKKIITLADGTKLESEEVLVALGRSVDLSGLGLDEFGIEWSRKGVKVNPQTMQLKDNIYAAGDITGLCLLAHAASAQGEAAAKNMLGQGGQYNNDLIPRAIYTWPEIASVGLTKAQAEAAGKTVKLHKIFMLAVGRAVAQDDTEGFFQIVEEEASGKILGAQLAGNSATELIHIPLVAMSAGMTAGQLKEIVFAHPSFAEGIKEAL